MRLLERLRHTCFLDLLDQEHSHAKPVNADPAVTLHNGAQ